MQAFSWHLQTLIYSISLFPSFHISLPSIDYFNKPHPLQEGSTQIPLITSCYLWLRRLTAFVFRGKRGKPRVYLSQEILQSTFGLQDGGNAVPALLGPISIVCIQEFLLQICYLGTPGEESMDLGLQHRIKPGLVSGLT